MTAITVMYLEFYMSLISFALVAWWYVVPALRKRSFTEAITPILILHSFRHFGLFYISPVVVPNPPPADFSIPTAYGDLATAVLALVALAAVRKLSIFSIPAVWLFNIVGVLDLFVAVLNAQRFNFASYSIGVAYMLPILVVPALYVTHALAFWLLLRRAPEAALA